MAESDQPSTQNRLLFTDLDASDKGRPDPDIDTADLIPEAEGSDSTAFYTLSLPSIDELASSLEIDFEDDSGDAVSSDQLSTKGTAENPSPNHDQPHSPSRRSARSKTRTGVRTRRDAISWDAFTRALRQPDRARERPDLQEDGFNGNGNDRNGRQSPSSDSLSVDMDDDELVHQPFEGEYRGHRLGVRPPRDNPYGGLTRLKEWYRPPEGEDSLQFDDAEEMPGPNAGVLPASPKSVNPSEPYQPGEETGMAHPSVERQPSGETGEFPTRTIDIFSDIDLDEMWNSKGNQESLPAFPAHPGTSERQRQAASTTVLDEGSIHGYGETYSGTPQPNIPPESHRFTAGGGADVSFLDDIDDKNAPGAGKAHHQYQMNIDTEIFSLDDLIDLTEVDDHTGSDVAPPVIDDTAISQIGSRSNSRQNDAARPPGEQGQPPVLGKAVDESLAPDGQSLQPDFGVGGTNNAGEHGGENSGLFAPDTAGELADGSVTQILSRERKASGQVAPPLPPAGDSPSREMDVDDISEIDDLLSLIDDSEGIDGSVLPPEIGDFELTDPLTIPATELRAAEGQRGPAVDDAATLLLDPIDTDGIDTTILPPAVDDADMAAIPESDVDDVPGAEFAGIPATDVFSAQPRPTAPSSMEEDTVAVDPMQVMAGLDEADFAGDSALDDEMAAMLAEDEEEITGQDMAAAEGKEGVSSATARGDYDAASYPFPVTRLDRILDFGKRIAHRVIPMRFLRRVERMIAWKENWWFYCDLLAALIASASLAIIIAYHVWYRV